MTSRHHVLLAAILVAGVVGVLLVYGPELDKRKIFLDLGNIILAIGALFAVLQWRESLEQQALEKYETGIAAANAVSAKCESVRQMMSHHYPRIGSPEGQDERAEYVYLQLDNLEYALERYVQGFASAYTTARAVMTFYNRCVSTEFRERVREQLDAASYAPVVRDAVEEILARF